MKVAICGTWHVHAPLYTNVAKMTEGVEVVGVYEENEALSSAMKAQTMS